MRTLSFLAILAIASIGQAQGVLVSVQDVKISVDLPSIDFSRGNRMFLPAVQPTAFIEVTVVSCAERSLVLEKQEIDGISYLKLLDQKLVDCMGPQIPRQYNLQISSDATGEQYVLLNPIQPSFK